MNPLAINYDSLNVSGITTAKLLIRGGSGSDPYKKKGLHQLLGSLLTRGCGPFNNIHLANLIEGCGASLRCETYEDGLLLSLKCSYKDSRKLLPVLGWMINKPHLDINQLELEKDLSIQALRRQNESPFLIAYDEWRKLSYTKGPYAYDPLGIESHIKEITRNDLIELSESIRYKEKFLVLAGNVEDNQLKGIEEYESFKEFTFSYKDDHYNRNEANSSNHIKSVNNINCTSKAIDTEQVVIILGKPTLPHFHNEDLILSLLCCHLGCGMSSILFRKLREEHGVAYEVGAHHPARELEAPFVIHAATSEEKALLTLQLLYETWVNLRESYISQEDLNLMKSKYIGQIAHNSQTSGQRAERIAQLRSLKLPINHDQKCIQRVRKINQDEIRHIADLHLSKPLLSLCGPSKTIEKLIKYWESK